MTEQQLAAIEERAAAATEPPWDYEQIYGHSICPFRLVYEYEGERLTIAINLDREDAEFIAAARDDVPALVAEVRKLRGLLGELQWIHFHGHEQFCPVCNASAENETHGPNCRLAAALGEP